MTVLADATGSAAVSGYIVGTASLLTVALVGYIARIARKFMGEHDWLISTTKQNTKDIAENTNAIRRMLEQREKLISQRDRRRR